MRLKIEAHGYDFKSFYIDGGYQSITSSYDNSFFGGKYARDKKNVKPKFFEIFSKVAAKPCPKCSGRCADSKNMVFIGIWDILYTLISGAKKICGRIFSA